MIVCFTGHRELGSVEEKKRLYARLLLQVEESIKNGATVFRTGGALGFDTAAALAVLETKKKHPSIRLELLLPCPNQTSGWSARQIEVYETIRDSADFVTYLSKEYFPGVMHKRNRALVDGADACIACWNGGARGGTAYTVNYALKKGIPVINLAQGE